MCYIIAFSLHLVCNQSAVFSNPPENLSTLFTNHDGIKNFIDACIQNAIAIISAVQFPDLNANFLGFNIIVQKMRIDELDIGQFDYTQQLPSVLQIENIQIQLRFDYSIIQKQYPYFCDSGSGKIRGINVAIQVMPDFILSESCEYHLEFDTKTFKYSYSDIMLKMSSSQGMDYLYESGFLLLKDLIIDLFNQQISTLMILGFNQAVNRELIGFPVMAIQGSCMFDYRVLGISFDASGLTLFSDGRCNPVQIDPTRQTVVAFSDNFQVDRLSKITLNDSQVTKSAFFTNDNINYSIQIDVVNSILKHCFDLGLLSGQVSLVQFKVIELPRFTKFAFQTPLFLALEIGGKNAENVSVRVKFTPEFEYAHNDQHPYPIRRLKLLFNFETDADELTAKCVKVVESVLNQNALTVFNAYFISDKLDVQFFGNKLWIVGDIGNYI